MEKICVFCEIFDKLLLKETVYSRVIINYCPLGKFALLVTPKRHVSLITDLKKEELIDLVLLYQETIMTINEKFEIPPIFGWFNQGQEAGQTIDHFHFHIALYEKNGNLKLPERIGEKTPISEDLLINIKKIFAQ